MAGYIAKYATKSTEDAGGVAHRIEHEHELDRSALPRARAPADHRGVAAGDGREVDTKRVRRWAHQFGFGGHCFTKSRRYSRPSKRCARHALQHAAAAVGGGRREK